MHIAYIVDVPPGDKRSAGILTNDFIQEASNQGHAVTVLVPDHTIKTPYETKKHDGATIIHLKTPETKVAWGDNGKGGKTLPQKLRRGFAELSMPYFMWHHLPEIPKLDGIIFYSPSVFFAPLVARLKHHHQCPVYEILRDLYPDQLVQSGDISARGIPYKIMSWATKRQHALANTIGVGESQVAQYLKNHSIVEPEIQLLRNWMFPLENQGCPIDVSKRKIAGRKIFVYAGTMGSAQGVDIFFDMAASLKDRSDIGFLFVGFGSEVERLKQRIQDENLDNVLIENPIKPHEIAGLYNQCHVGLLSLSPDLPNIPGKFVSYMQQGIPVFGLVSEGNDMIDMVKTYNAGVIATHEPYLDPTTKTLKDRDAFINDLCQKAVNLIDNLKKDNEIAARCQQMGRDIFLPSAAVKQVISTLQRQQQYNP